MQTSLCIEKPAKSRQVVMLARRLRGLLLDLSRQRCERAAWLGHDHRHAMGICRLAIRNSRALLALRMQFASTAFAGSALCGHTQFELQIVKRRTRARHMSDVAV
jgi:hypothetical protein